MTPLSNITGSMLTRFLKEIGYKKVRQRGSHSRFKHRYRPTITLNVFGKKTIKPGRLQGLLNEMQIDKGEFFEFFGIQAKRTKR